MRFQDILSGLYLDYKLRQGYSPNDIIGKSRSLKGVLEPFRQEVISSCLSELVLRMWTVFSSIFALKVSRIK